MVYTDPTSWTAGQWALGYVMAMSGGIVNCYTRYKRQKKNFSLVDFLGEVFTAGFVGMAVYMVLASLQQDMGLCAAAAGVSGHMATRLLSLIESKLLNKIKETDL